MPARFSLSPTRHSLSAISSGGFSSLTPTPSGRRRPPTARRKLRRVRMPRRGSLDYDRVLWALPALVAAGEMEAAADARNQYGRLLCVGHDGNCRPLGQFGDHRAAAQIAVPMTAMRRSVRVPLTGVA